MDSDMEEEFKDRQKVFEDRFIELKELRKFCLHSYDYHHKNNEMEILQNKMEMLRSAQEICRNTRKEIEKLHDTVENAQKRRKQIEEALLELGIKLPSNDSVDNLHFQNDAEANKENIM